MIDARMSAWDPRLRPALPAPPLLAQCTNHLSQFFAICEAQFAPQVRAAVALAAERGATVEHVICVDEALAGCVALAEIEATAPEGIDFESAWRAVAPEDLLTIVYTSGTTGPPKGVELTHTNFLENARVVDEFGGGSPADRVISYLPDAHAANRWLSHYLSILTGGQITTCPDLGQVAAALSEEVHPTVFLGVPRVWVKVKAALEERFAAPSEPRSPAPRSPSPRTERCWCAAAA
ncbi:AMP-binding protein [Nocardia sp. NPDC059764]|uniref:AMP-binding protein n=1 Tax=Nocardia sp. NPDC059764 TaxID=3346939 RepID=UPI003662ED7C